MVYLRNFTGLLSVLLLLLPGIASAQRGVFYSQNKPLITSPTAALEHQVYARCTYATDCTCSGNDCTLTVPSIASGHGLMLFSYETGGLAAPTISGGCSSWSNQSNAHAASGPAGGISGATCTSGTSGTSVTASWGSAPGDAAFVWLDFSCTLGTISFDVANNRNAGVSEDPGAGPSLTLTGTNDFIGQVGIGGSNAPTSVASPYGTNFRNTTTNGSVTMGFVAGSNVVNTNSGTATSWTFGSAQFNISSAMAMKCQ